MVQPLVVEQSLEIPVSPDTAFRGTLAMDAPTVFRRWHGPFPPIKQVLDQTGDWESVGQTRTLTLVGGGGMREELASVDPSRSFGYPLSDVKGAMSLLVNRVQGEWTFEPSVAGTKVTWRWTVHPVSALAAPALPVLGRLWHGYARKGLDELSGQLAR